MLQSINFHIWFKVCRPLKHKYKLSVNCLLVLNGIYIYNCYIGKQFTRRQIEKFVSYYDPFKTKGFIYMLEKLGYIYLSGNRKTIQLYSISEKGITVIKELQDNYYREFDKFINLYGISL